MSTSQKLYVQLAALVIIFYFGATYLPQITGTCMDGECGFTIGEIVVSIAFPIAFFALPVIAEMLIYKKNLRQALNDMGISRFSWRGIRLAVVYVVPVALFNPLYAWVTGMPLQVKPTWVWFVLSAVLVNGLAEETLMRAYVFRHLREGRTFWRAAAISTLYFAIYHLPLFFSAGVMIGLVGVIVAIPIGFVTAYIYERGDNTIWGPGLLHAVNNALAYIFVFTPETQPIATSLYMGTGIAISTLMLAWAAFRKNYGREPARTLQPVVSQA